MTTTRCLFALLLLSVCRPMAAQVVGITEFPTAVPPARTPAGIAAGPDGALWFTESGNNSIGRITTAGVITEFPLLSSNAGPVAIAAGPDGALWFTEQNVGKIGRITTAGVVTEFPLASSSASPIGITAGPDGAMWFAESEAHLIGRIPTSGAPITEFSSGNAPADITAGPDGALWYTEPSANKIGRITTTGSLSEFTTANTPSYITAGPDGALWFTEDSASKIARITTSGGSIIEYLIPTSASLPAGITAGPDGALWFVETNGNRVGRISTTGTFSETPIPTAGSLPQYITTGSDGALWFTEKNSSKIARAVIIPALVSTTTCPAPDGVRGTFYSFAPTVTGGTGSYQWSIVGSTVLPPGLSINPTSGVISGIPTASDLFGFTLGVQSGTGSTAQKISFDCTIQINQPTTSLIVITTTCPAPGAILNVPYSLPITTQNNSGLPLFYTLLSGSVLPPGTGLNSSGAIVGTPTALGTYTFSVRVNNSGGDSATYTCSIVVSLPLTITATCPAPSGALGVTYSFPITTTGGQGQPAFRSVGSPLPPGLGLNTQSGVIGGIPTVPGSYPITILVTDGSTYKPQTATYTCTIVIYSQLTLSAVCPATVGAPGTPYSFPVTAFGGQAPLTWTLINGVLPPGLGLNSQTGVISGIPTTVGGFPITIQVSDSAPGSLQQTVNYTCNIFITNQLTITALCPALSGTPNTPYSFPITVIGGTAPYSWSLTSGPLPPGLGIDSTTGIISGTPTTSGTYPITVTVTDSSGKPGVPSNSKVPLTATYTCSIVIATQLTLTALCPAASGTPGVPYSFPISVAGGNGPYTWALVNSTPPPGLNLNTQTGVISGTPTTLGTFPITVRVTDSGTQTTTPQTVTYTCSIVISSLRFTATCPTALTVNVPFSLTLTVSGGLAPLTFALTSGPLPPGLQLDDTTGIISGTPTTTGSYPITVTVTGSSSSSFGAAPTAQYTCTFVVTTPPLTITAGCPAAIPVNVPFSFAITATGGLGTRAYVLTSGVLPPGLHLDGLSGVLSGIPTIPGAYQFSVTVSDSSTSPGQAPVYSCTIVVTSAPLRITALCPASGLLALQGVAFSFAVTATGGAAPLSWTPISLPAGLQVNTQTGLISGTPTGAPGTSAVNVLVRDSGLSSGQQSASFSCNLTVSSSLTITTGCPLPTVRTGTSLSPFSLTATGGTGNYTFSLAGGAPSGLSISGSTIGGSISASSGSYVFSLQVSDGQQTVQKSCSMTVAPTAFQIISSCPVSPVTQGVPFTDSLSSTGGLGDAGWQVTLGSLPPGLTLVGNTISGTPGGPPGTSTFTLQASSGDQIGTLNCTLVVNPPKLQFTGTCPGNGTQGAVYGPFPLSATGGLGASTYTFSVVNGSLPPGVSLSGNTIGGTPIAPAGTSNFQLSVASGTQTAVGPACTVVIAPLPLQITGSCPAGPSLVGGGVSLSTSVTGGKAPYTFAINGPSFLSLSTGPSGATATGTATDPGSFPVSITVTDSAQSAPATFSCTLTINPAPLTLGGSCPVNPVLAGAAVSLPLTAAGGKAPYGWSLNGTSGLSLASAAGSSNTVSGSAPADPGSYTLGVTLTDSMNSQPATLSCPLTVQLPPLQITGTCPASALDLPVNISVPLTAAGGKQPYSWSFTGPSWLSATPATGPTTTVAVSGTPASSGPFTFTVTLADGANSTPATFTCNSTINPPPIPPISVTGLTAPSTLFAPVSVSLQLAAPTPLPLTGVVQLSFVPNAFGETDNPQVVFDGRDATPAGRSFAFTVAAGGTAIPLPNIQQGTVAGTIHVEVTALTEGTRDVLPSPHPFRELVIAKQAPIVAATDVSFTNETATGFDIVISGFSTPRDMKTVSLVFAAQDGASLDGTTTFSTDVSAVFAAYYTAHLNAGSMFTGLDIPITVTGDKSAIQSVKITLTNSVGDSQPITKTR